MTIIRLLLISETETGEAEETWPMATFLLQGQIGLIDFETFPEIFLSLPVI